MIAKNCGAVVPRNGPSTAEDDALLENLSGMLAETRAAHAAVRPDQALDAIWARVSAVSYTHLDVYKRQILESILLDTMFELPGMETVEEVTVDGDVVKGLKPPVQILRAEIAA